MEFFITDFGIYNGLMDWTPISGFAPMIMDISQMPIELIQLNGDYSFLSPKGKNNRTSSQGTMIVALLLS